ncbi:MAG: UDP-N-acetylmuramoylalanine--D-glutamate ligase [Frankiales bacterium]|jgi:UDP-N-acetylmuramoylalanine--D-glutamate ligase|nr:UDP-N-acetylmuramoylalanine--D-glutamate ligase [Frankiales bacterium]
MTGWDTRRVAVAGLGVSGQAAALALAGLGADVIGLDVRDGDFSKLEAAGVRVALGPPVLPDGVDLVVTSPGWRPDSPLLAAALAAGVPVWGEVELAWRLRGPEAAPWLALTGTNGKTTTVGMLDAILRAAGHRSVAAGNVGTALVEVVGGPYDVIAVELSSFQLHWSSTVAPLAAAVLNLAPDHLDWHGSLEAYIEAKAKIWTSSTVAVGNADDPVTLALLDSAPGRQVSFSLAAPRTGQLGLVEDLLVDRAFVADPVHGAVELATLDDLQLTGAHNVANALAAAALARAYGVPAEAVRDGLRGVTPAAHRNAPVATVAGVAYVDDSKATNPHAAAASLGGYTSVVWVAGGLLKGADVEDLVRVHGNRMRAAVLLGTDRALIREALARHAPDVPVREVEATDTGAMTTVVAVAAGLAQPGDTVLLAPAAASMDMFRDYAARGDAFAAAVHAIGAAR